MDGWLKTVRHFRVANTKNSISEKGARNSGKEEEETCELRFTMERTGVVYDLMVPRHQIEKSHNHPHHHQGAKPGQPANVIGYGITNGFGPGHSHLQSSLTSMPSRFGTGTTPFTSVYSSKTSTIGPPLEVSNSDVQILKKEMNIWFEDFDRYLQQVVSCQPRLISSSLSICDRAIICPMKPQQIGPPLKAEMG